MNRAIRASLTWALSKKDVQGLTGRALDAVADHQGSKRVKNNKAASTWNSLKKHAKVKSLCEQHNTERHSVQKGPP
jgi:hypothetical protein